MNDKLVIAAGENLVEAAIREGKIPESRRALYLKKMAKRPKATAKLLARLEPVLEPDAEPLSSPTARTQAAPAGPTASGLTGYPGEWLRPGEVGAGKAGSITFEDATSQAAALSVLGL